MQLVSTIMTLNSLMTTGRVNLEGGTIEFPIPSGQIGGGPARECWKGIMEMADAWAYNAIFGLAHAKGGRSLIRFGVGVRKLLDG